MNPVGEVGMLAFTAVSSCTLTSTFHHHQPRAIGKRSSSTVSSVRPMEPHPASSEAKDVSDKKKPNYVFIVNPNGSNGKTAANWKKLFPKLSLRLGDYTVSEKLTTGPYHATQLTREAIHGGAAAIIAVGGDGTLHEVVNGFFEAGKRVVQPEESGESNSSSRTALGLIPLGTGSDFARFYGWNSDPIKALDRIAKGEKKKIDVGRVTYGKEQVERFFVNVADLHLSAKSGFYAGKHKALGNFCYVVGCLRAFWGHRNRDLKIRVNNGDWQTVSKVSAICVGNSSYFGGGMKIAPAANPSSGDLEVVTLNDFKWYDFLMQLPNLYAGTHVEKNTNVTSVKVRTLDVEEVAIEENYPGTYVQADGEHLGFLNASFSVLPGAIDLIL